LFQHRPEVLNTIYIVAGLINVKRVTALRFTLHIKRFPKPADWFIITASFVTTHAMEITA